MSLPLRRGHGALEAHDQHRRAADRDRFAGPAADGALLVLDLGGRELAIELERDAVEAGLFGGANSLKDSGGARGFGLGLTLTGTNPPAKAGGEGWSSSEPQAAVSITMLRIRATLRNRPSINPDFQTRLEELEYELSRVEATFGDIVNQPFAQFPGPRRLALGDRGLERRARPPHATAGVSHGDKG